MMATPTEGIMKPVGKRQRRRQVSRVVQNHLNQSCFSQDSQRRRLSTDIVNELDNSECSQMINVPSSVLQNEVSRSCNQSSRILLQNTSKSSSSSSDSGSSDESHFICNNCSGCQQRICVCANEKLRNDLKSWAVRHQITQASIGDLLAILRPAHPTLPQDARTLLGTASSGEISVICGGEYLHFDLIKQLCNVIDGGLQETDGEMSVNKITLVIQYRWPAII